MRKRRIPDNIPFEIQVEIIKWLPVKSLVVFRSVSKAWKLMIDSPRFITDHANMRRHHRLLIRYKIVNKFTHYKIEFKYDSIKDDDTLSQHTVSNVPVSFQRLKELDLVGMSQGLLCLFGGEGWGCDKETAVIWNPLLGKSIAIDVPTKHMIGATVLGFGVRPDNCDPMIVMIKYVEHHDHKVMVFTLSSRVWRVPRGNQPPKSISFNNWHTIAADWRIYWKAYEIRRNLNLVLEFDMVCEDFTEIHLPLSVAHRFCLDFSISMIKDSLALFDYVCNAEKPVWEVWMMVEDGVSKSFRKLFIINTPNASLKKQVLGFRKNDQPILETAIDEYSVSTIEVYEPRRGPIKNLGINGKYGSSFCSYAETLLLLDQLDEQSVKIQLQL